MAPAQISAAGKGELPPHDILQQEKVTICSQHPRDTHIFFRWERADQLGLEPPQNVLHLLQQLETDPQKQLDLWANRI